MKFSLPQRFTAAILSAVTALSCMTVSVPLAGAADEDNKASAIEIKVGETYNVADKGVSKAWFQQNGTPRNVWPMYTKASDGTTIRAYCADHAKTNPGSGGKPYTVTGKVSDMHVYGVATRSDSRTTLNEFISWVQAPLTASNFTADMYFSASQAAIWVALGDAQIAANSSFGVSYTSSTALGYRASGKTLSASTTSEALTLYAAIKMLEYGNTFYNVWGPNGKNHAPWTGCTINYTPGSSTYSAANVKNGSINLTGGIIKSGVFAEKQIDGQTCLVLPMAAASATFVRGNKITLKADKLPTGAFLMSETGTKSTNGTLTLGNVRNDKTLYKNGNDMAYGETFLLCIPKTTAEQMDAADTKLLTSVTATMNVDRYDVYVASTNASGVQPVILVEPAVKQSAAQLVFVNPEVAQGTVRVRILKTDEAGAGLAGCIFELTYPGQKAPLIGVSSASGEVVFNDLPLNTNVTIKETAAPEGYTLLPAKTVNTGTKSGQTIELQLANSSDHTFKIHKISSADGRNLMGAVFEIRGIDNDYKRSFTTNALGEITVQGRDLPKGSFEVYETAAPEGYVTDGSDIQTFEWSNTKDIELTFKNAPHGGIRIYKYDKDTTMPLPDATFEIRRDGQVLATLKTDINGSAEMNNLTKGFYQVVEVEPPAGYLKDDQVHEVYIDPTADPTKIIREVNIANTKKLSIRIVKIDKQTKVPLSGWKFDVFYNDAHLTSVTTDENGEVMLTNLQPGTYRIKETGGDTEHYNMDAPEQTVELVKDQAEIPTLTFANTPKTHFGIYKMDDETHRPIEGVTFAIYRDGKPLGNYTTDANGRIWLPYAEPGTYQAQEIITDPHYILNSEMFTIENNSEYPTFFTIPNKMKKDITVKKIDKDTGKPLQGVVFEGFRDGKSIGYFTTGADGTFTISYAEPGTYTFKEYHTLAGYVLNTEPITLEHTTDRNAELVVDNTLQKKFEVIKVDSQTKQPLAGVQFKIWRDGVLLGDYTTDKDGKITLEKASAGTYKVQEVATLKEYILNDKPYEIEHTTAKDSSLTIENAKKPGLSIKKIDAETKKPLANAVFKLTRANGDIIKEDIRTGEDGTAFVEGLDAADYIVTEITAPGGYIIDKTPHPVSLEEGKTYTLTLENEKKPGLLIKKVDAQTHKALPGATFKITRGDGSVVRESVTTNIDGIAHLPELETGTYIITETIAPSGYVIDDTPKTVQLRKGQTYEVVFSNSRSYGLQIRKIIKGTNKPLSGCVFQVSKANGEIIGKYTTNSAGLATVSGLEDGVYVVTELSCPEGYRLDSTPQNVIVKSGELATVEFQNEKLASIRIKKIDAVTKKGIYGVRFLVKDESNNLIGEYSTDQDGYIELRDILTDGTSEIKLKVEEIAAAQGYVPDSTVRTLRIRRGETTELVVENTPVLGQIQVVKKSSQDNPVTNQLKGSLLQGAVFEVENAETGRIVDTITSDPRGIAASNPLPLGRYFVREIKAPRFYQLNTQKVEVKLKVEGDVVRIKMYNDAASIKTSIKKTGNYTVDAGDNMRYDITNVANQSNVPLDNFFWHDRIPTDAVRVGTITTGTYNARVWYKITYKTNKNGYRVLADNLLSTNRYSFKVDSGSLKLAIGEYVTDIRYEFGTVPAGCKMTEKATVYVYVPPYMANGYNITNRVDCGGSYQGEWDSSTSAWVTKIHRAPIYTKPTLPKTGY